MTEHILEIQARTVLGAPGDEPGAGISVLSDLRTGEVRRLASEGRALRADAFRGVAALQAALHRCGGTATRTTGEQLAHAAERLDDLVDELAQIRTALQGEVPSLEALISPDDPEAAVLREARVEANALLVEYRTLLSALDEVRRGVEALTLSDDPVVDLTEASEEERTPLDESLRALEGLRERARALDDEKRRLAAGRRELEEEIADLDAQVRRDRKIAAELTGRADALAAERDELARTMEGATAKSEALSVERERMRAELEELRERLERARTELEVERASYEVERAELTEQLAPVLAELDDVRRPLAGVEVQRDALRAQIEQARADYDAAVAEIAELRESCAALSEALTGVSDERQTLQAERDRLLDAHLSIVEPSPEAKDFFAGDDG